MMVLARYILENMLKRIGRVCTTPRRTVTVMKVEKNRTMSVMPYFRVTFSSLSGGVTLVPDLSSVIVGVLLSAFELTCHSLIR